MACHLLPQPWSTPKCVVYLDSSCDLSVNWNIGCLHSGLFRAYCILEISLSSLEAVQQLLLGDVPLSLSAPDSCTEPGSAGMMDITPFWCFLCGWGRFHLCFNNWREYYVLYFSYSAEVLEDRIWWFISLSAIVYLVYVNIKVGEIPKALFYTFGCLWQRGWVSPLMSALLFAVTLYKLFFWLLFITQQITYVFPKLIWAAVTPFRLHTVCSHFVSPLLAEYHQEMYIAAVKMMEKCSKRSQSVHFLLLLEVELGSSGVQQTWVTHQAHILSLLFFTRNSCQKFLVSWNILQMTQFLLVCLQMFSIEL